MWSKWQRSGSCVCVFQCPLFNIIVITTVPLFLWTVLTCDPREPLLWSQSDRGSICGKAETKACSNYSPAHPVSVSTLQQRLHRSCEICRAVAEKRRSRSSDAKSWGSVGGMETLINAKNGFCLFFSLSIKHRRLMQFHSQVWFSLAPIHCLKGWWRLRIFTLSNYQPLCPPTGLINLFSTFLGVTKCISAALSLVFGEHVAGEPSQH